MTDPQDRYAHLSTEQPNLSSKDLDRLTSAEFVDLMQREDERVLEALAKVREELAVPIEELAKRFRSGGRLFYVGAGTSGRLGMLDAAECPPTFGTDPDLVQSILAGGYECLVRSVEGAEDKTDEGAAAIDQRGVSAKDFVLGIAASSTTPFVRGALERAKSIGAFTVFLTCHENPKLDFPIDRIVVLDTGPEVLTGSTRLKAGTATKLFLNRLTTGAMVRIGKVYENRMVDLYLTCDKLRERAIRTTREFTGLDREGAVVLLQKMGGSVKTAILAHRRNLDREAAEDLIARAGGMLREALSLQFDTSQDKTDRT
jgi:N-acetylmuramic acid 6-phosphate etherase